MRSSTRFSAIDILPTSPSLVAVLGDEPDAFVEDAAHARADELLAVQRDRAAHTVLEADDRLGEFGLAVALHARDRDDLAGAHVEADVVDDDLVLRVDDR